MVTPPLPPHLIYSAFMATPPGPPYLPPLPLAQARPCLSVEPLFLRIFGTIVFVVSDVTWVLKTIYHTLQPDDVCFEVILSHF